MYPSCIIRFTCSSLSSSRILTSVYTLWPGWARRGTTHFTVCFCTGKNTSNLSPKASTHIKNRFMYKYINWHMGIAQATWLEACRNLDEDVKSFCRGGQKYGFLDRDHWWCCLQDLNILRPHGDVFHFYKNNITARLW